MVEGFDVGVGEPRLATDVGHRRAEPDPISRSHGGLEDGTDFGLGAAIVGRGADLQGAMGFVGEVAMVTAGMMAFLHQ